VLDAEELGSVLLIADAADARAEPHPTWPRSSASCIGTAGH
jgi:hypothetical protein